MVRNLMMMLGMPLAIAAFGCDGTDGTGGAGGIGGDCGIGGIGGATPVDACINQDDLSIVCDDQFDLDVQTCATDNVGDGADTSVCLQCDRGVSKACADCYGITTECTLENCLLFCSTDPFNNACKACRIVNCVEEFDACRGDLATACAM